MTKESIELGLSKVTPHKRGANRKAYDLLVGFQLWTERDVMQSHSTSSSAAAECNVHIAVFFGSQPIGFICILQVRQHKQLTVRKSRTEDKLFNHYKTFKVISTNQYQEEYKALKEKHHSLFPHPLKVLQWVL